MADQVKRTAPSVRAMKGRTKIVCITAYDAVMARLADNAGVDVVLVGDSLGNVVLGYPTTVPVTLHEMIHHTKAARRGVQHALLIADLPFGSYGASVEQGVRSATALVKAGAEAVKLEGDFPETIEAIVKLGIPVMSHLGMTPQSVNRFGGFKVQGKSEASAQRLLSELKSVESAGAFSVVLELVPAALAERATRETSIATIGIGAGAGCDGQIQVIHDVLGLTDAPLRHVRRFAELGTQIADALCEYTESVRLGEFPTEDQAF
ncbi:MAG TPA: 3-methyl-2-oxobutanoate hydroxymethyltransferase [Fimbriimonadaceae bacterium]|nr:3-methyl-2-oxobutanoate hydroxymethyltransferase [Fimbriimonadaceae bacterium]